MTTQTTSNKQQQPGSPTVNSDIEYQRIQLQLRQEVLIVLGILEDVKQFDQILGGALPPRRCSQLEASVQEIITACHKVADYFSDKDQREPHFASRWRLQASAATFLPLIDDGVYEAFTPQSKDPIWIKSKKEFHELANSSLRLLKLSADFYLAASSSE